MTHPDYTSLEQRLVAALHQEASIAMTTTDTQRELERWHDRQGKRKNRFRIGVAAACAAAVAGIILGIVYGFSGSDSSRREPIKQPQPIKPQTSSVESVAAVPSATAVVTVKGPVNLGAVSFGSVWATGLEESAGHIYRLDPSSGDIVSSTAYTPFEDSDGVPVRVGDVVMVAAMHGKQSGYAAFDRTGKPAGFIAAEDAGIVTGDATGGWIQTDTQTIARVDASGVKVVRTVDLPDPENDGVVLRGMAVAGDSLYLVMQAGNSLYRLDAATGDVKGHADVDVVPAGVAATQDAVYVASEDYQLERFNPTLQLTATSHNAVPLGSFYIPIVTADGVWVTPDEGGIVELDATTLKPIASYQILPHKDPGFDFGGAVSNDRLFVGSIGPARVASIPRK